MIEIRDAESEQGGKKTRPALPATTFRNGAAVHDDVDSGGAGGRERWDESRLSYPSDRPDTLELDSRHAVECTLASVREVDKAPYFWHARHGAQHSPLQVPTFARRILRRLMRWQL